MAKQKHLDRPPIVEALIDVHARFAESTTPDFASFGGLVKDRYPTTEKRISHTVEWKLEKNEVQSSQGSEIDAYLFRSAEGTEVVQSRPTGFAFSRLKPYGTWESMFAEAWRLWCIYRDAFRPVSVTRIATRFINRLEFPGAAVDLDDYLTIGPKLPPNGPQGLQSFSIKMSIPFPSGTIAAIRCTDQTGAASPAVVTILLDLDVMRVGATDPADDEAIRSILAELRTVKNGIFFDSLTERALEVF